MSHRRRQQLGPFSVGEKPLPLQITFTDNDGTAINLTGYAADFVIEKIDADEATDSNLGTGVSSLPTPASGVTQYAWVAADFAFAGRYQGQMWVGNGTNLLASIEFWWDVVDVTAAPSI